MQDLELFIEREIGQHLAPRVDKRKAAELLLEKCGGLFLHAEKLLNHNTKQGLTLDDISSFPEGLQAFYSEQLVRVRTKNSKKFTELVLPLLGYVLIHEFLSTAARG